MSKDSQALIKQLEIHITELTKSNQKLQSRVDKTNLLHQVSVALSKALDFETIATQAVEFSQYLGATSGEIHLLSDTGEVYFRSTYPERNDLDDVGRQTLVRRVLQEGLDAWVLETGQLALVLDTRQDDRWLAIEYADQTVSVRSAICAPITIGRGRLKGAISFVHPEPNHFDQQDLNLLGNLTSHLETALDNAYQMADVKNNLAEAKLMLDLSRYLAGNTNVKGVYRALLRSVAAIEAEKCALFMCQGLSSNNLPTHARLVYIGDVTDPQSKSDLLDFQFSLAEHSRLFELVRSREGIVIENISAEETLSAASRHMMEQLGVHSLVINPLLNRIRVIGFLMIGFKSPHIFTGRELTLYQTLTNQTWLALEHVRQIEQTEEALAETQTLYRAGRVLAGLKRQEEIFREALVEFVYGLGLDQGGIVLLSPDRKHGQLMAYLEGGELKQTEALQIPIDEHIPYQKILLSGQPFASADCENDDQLAGFRNFNPSHSVKSIVQAPLIVEGTTVGWIGADAVHEPRNFSRREMDLARAMADQVAIALQNRNLLEQSQRRAEQLRAVATVGEAVTGLTDLDEVMNLTVNLIRDRFGFYHVSIFLLDNAREWAVVKASTGEVGKIMVERPHRLAVGSNSIVGYATYHAQPRIALDVGQDAVHFNNPLLPETRSEMALPLISRGTVIGALDVQSVVANAFTDEDVETLQIMADQVTTAIETARLFEETQRRLHEQAALYRIGSRISSTLKLQATTDILVNETAHLLNVARCALTLLDEEHSGYTISDHVRQGSLFTSKAGEISDLTKFSTWSKLRATRQEIILHLDDADNSDPEATYLKEHNGIVMALVPILLRNEMIGVLEIYDDQPDRRLTQDDITLLESVALLAANSIENARLYESVQESQSFMRVIINQIPDPIFIKDEQGKFVVVNSAFTQEVLGLPETDAVGYTDEDFLPPEQVNWFQELSRRMFDTGQPQEIEGTFVDNSGRTRNVYMRNVPLIVTSDRQKPEYLIGVIQDISERKRREKERERLIEDTGITLQRTQTLYRIGNILGGQLEVQTILERVLGHFLSLLDLKQGSILLFNQSILSSVSEARYAVGVPVKPNLTLPLSEDRVSQQLRVNPRPLVINEPETHRLTKNRPRERGEPPTAILFIPLLARYELIGTVAVEATQTGYQFGKADVEVGRAIADQLTIWLENRRLLEEAQHRSDSLQTAAEVSRAASSILDIDELIETSVNAIRSQFNFYYVGLFRVEGDYAVLKAGTGEAGKIQLARHHKLKIGGESMIGWSVANRKARIALDVGEEAVHFRNPVLPDTRSEMALPLISRDEVLGALTIQSTKRLAFSDEDIALLQTMADQLANAIKNAELFSQTQEALAEAEALYQMAQALSTARDETTIFEVAIANMAQTEVDAAAIYTYHTETDDEGVTQFVDQPAVWSRSDELAIPQTPYQPVAGFKLESLVPDQEALLVDDLEHDARLSNSLRKSLKELQIGSLLIVPLAVHQHRLGFLLVTYKQNGRAFSKNQIRYFTTVAQQIVITLENLRLLDESQKRARREQIIREITAKIRSATDVNDILRVTVSEVGKLVSTRRGRIVLGTPENGNETDKIGDDRLPAEESQSRLEG